MISRSGPPGESSPFELLAVASKLGITSFGGPVAHLGYFRREYVERRRWVDEQTFAEIVAICQSLPGPTSSEVGIAIGLLRAGPLGAFFSWLGFTFPSVVLMAGFALLFDRLPFEAGWVFPILHLVALVVVARAVWQMARALAPDVIRRVIALLAATAVLAVPTSEAQVAVIAVAALAGWRLGRASPAPELRVAVPIGRRVAATCFGLYLAMLLALPVARLTVPSGEVRLVDSFYRSGALVFGGGHVVLPLLHAEVVPAGWVSESRFVAGYGAAQLVPGPLFSFAAYLGALSSGVAGAALATIAIFLSAFLLVFAALPSWGALRARPWARSALGGVNAAVVGLLVAALVNIARAIASALV